MGEQIYKNRTAFLRWTSPNDNNEPCIGFPMKSGNNTEFNSVKFVDRRTINFFFPRLVLHRVAKLSIVHLCVYRVVTTCFVSYRLENAHILFPLLPQDVFPIFIHN